MSTEQEAIDHRELAKFESKVLSQLVPEAGDNLDGQQAGAEAPGAQSTEPQAPAPTASAAASTAAPATTEGEKTGDPRAALRAARRSERQARAEVEAERRESAALRQQIATLTGKAPPVNGRSEYDEALEKLDVDVAPAAVAIRALRAEVQQLLPPAAPAPPPAFVPDLIKDEELQGAVDEAQFLHDWQHNPDQTAWRAAKRHDAILADLPAWKDKPLMVRLAEVERRVAADLGTPAPTPPPTPPGRQQILTAQARGIETLSDLRGGVGPSHNPGPDFTSMKSDEEIMAALGRG